MEHGAGQRERDHLWQGIYAKLDTEHFTMNHAVQLRKGTMRRVYKLVDYNEQSVNGIW